jgi:hypothetical protein
MNSIPIYAPLVRDYRIDKPSLVCEINSLIGDQAQERTLPFDNGRSVYDPEGRLSIASDEELNTTSKYYINSDGERVLIPGKIKTYHVFNLTYLPEEPESLIDIYRSDDPVKSIFWHTYKQPFTWRAELIGTELYKTVTQFPWEYVQGVRLIHMTPPSIGQIHRDSHPKSNYKYFRDGFASISINIDAGGGILKYLDHSGIEHCVDNNVTVFHFDDSVPHGVTPITSPRYQLRMWGKLSVPYSELFL